MVLASGLAEPSIDGEQVLSVVGHEGAPIGLCSFELLRIGQTPELGPFDHRLHVASKCAKLLRKGSGKHLVQQQPHRMARCSRRQTSSAASAPSALSRMRSSTSSGKALQ